MADHTTTSQSGRDAPGWSQTASQALALVQGTISGYCSSRQPPTTGAGQKLGHKDPLYFHWAPCPAPLGQNVELSRLEFGLYGTRATSKLQQSPGNLHCLICMHMTHSTQQIL